MSDLAAADAEPTACHRGEQEDSLQLLEASTARVGSQLTIRRALPQAKRRLIGAWCFLDHFGPIGFDDRHDGMWVEAHPHIGLQTVTWLFEGSVLHRDSLGSEERIVPGGLNVMTAGAGISHTEESPVDHSGLLHGVQLWVALPTEARRGDAAFEHVDDLPVWRDDGVEATVFAGEGFGVRSSARFFSPLLGAEVRVDPGGRRRLPLDPRFEHGIIVGEGEIVVGDQRVGPGKLLYLAPGRKELVVSAASDGARLALVGGEPFDERVLLWWNFVGGSHEEIAEARADWEAGRRFGTVEGFEGGRLDAPELRARLV